MSTFNWIQNHIIIELTRHQARRYSQLRPKNVESNLFMYHLRGLIRQNFIEKSDLGGYSLTATGRQHVERISLATGKYRQQPQILNAVVCRNVAGDYLFSRWHRQPNIGLVSFPHGMMHYGESVLEGAKRELSEKAGLAATLSYSGVVNVRSVEDGVMRRHMAINIFIAQQIINDETAILRTDASTHFWAPLEHMAAQEFIPGFFEIAQLVHDESAQLPHYADIIVGD